MARSRNHVMKKKNMMSHKEIMEKRHNKRKKKEKSSIQEKKKELLTEYMELNKVDETTDHKTVSQKIMEEVEVIKENGRMNDNSYLQIMDQLMALHSGKEKKERENIVRQNVGRYGIGYRAQPSDTHERVVAELRDNIIGNNIEIRHWPRTWRHAVDFGDAWTD